MQDNLVGFALRRFSRKLLIANGLTMLVRLVSGLGPSRLRLGSLLALLRVVLLIPLDFVASFPHLLKRIPGIAAFRVQPACVPHRDCGWEFSMVESHAGTLAQARHYVKLSDPHNVAYIDNSLEDGHHFENWLRPLPGLASASLLNGLAAGQAHEIGFALASL